MKENNEEVKFENESVVRESIQDGAVGDLVCELVVFSDVVNWF